MLQGIKGAAWAMLQGLFAQHKHIVQAHGARVAYPISSLRHTGAAQIKRVALKRHRAKEKK